MCTVVPSVPPFALIKPYSPLIFQIKMYKPLRRAQPAKKEVAQAYGTRVGCAARVCTFLFEILRVNRVLSVQIAAHWEQLHTLVCMS